MTGPAIALGSGGARGWCHIGALRALEARGVVPTSVAGCSMGALVGAAYCGGKLQELENWALALTQTRFLTYIDPTLERGGLVQGKAVGDMLREIGLPDRIEDLALPFVAVATDMATGQEVRLDSGNLFDAVRASISIPGVFSPYPIDGKWLLDGGMINPVPTLPLRERGAERVISVNPNGKFGDLWEPRVDDPLPDWLDIKALPFELPEFLKARLMPGEPQGPSYFDVVSTSMDIMTEYLRRSRAAECPADVTLEADLNHMMVLELYRAEEAITEGVRIVDAADLSPL